MTNYTIQKMQVHDLPQLASLFHYQDFQAMLLETAQAIQNKTQSIYALYHQDTIAGELHVRYQSSDTREAVKGIRAYLFAYRIRKDLQGKGIGQYFLKEVMKILQNEGYHEFTIGVEDENQRAAHIYQKLGFHEIIARKQECYGNQTCDYNLLLRKH